MMLGPQLQKCLNPKVIFRSPKNSSQVNKAQAVQTPTGIFPFPFECKLEVKNKGGWINGLLQHIATPTRGKNQAGKHQATVFHPVWALNDAHCQHFTVKERKRKNKSLQSQRLRINLQSEGNN